MITILLAAVAAVFLFLLIAKSSHQKELEKDLRDARNRLNEFVYAPKEEPQIIEKEVVKEVIKEVPKIVTKEVIKEVYVGEIDYSAEQQKMLDRVSKNNRGAEQTFVSLDFEYLYHNRYDTPCAVGMTKVEDNVIVGKYYSLIYQPKLDAKMAPNNDITPEMIADAPTYDKVYEDMVRFALAYPIVAHNVGTERKVLTDTTRPSHLPDLKDNYFVDTDALSGHKSLPALCEQYGIKLEHHNALSDAEATAEVYLRLCGTQSVRGVMRKAPTKGSEYYKNKSKESDDPDTFGTLPQEEWSDVITPFRGIRVCVSGTFANYSRNYLRAELKKLGATTDKKINKSTTMLICGDGVGPVKLEDIKAKGGQMIYENDLLQYIEPQM